EAELARQVARSPRKAIVERSLADHGVVVVVPDLDAAVDVANRRAPEHVEVLTRDPWPVAGRIRHAGAIYVGASSPEPGGAHRAPLRAEGRRRMAAVLAISAVVMLAEAAGGWVAHSLALLADAGHMLADVGALGLSLGVAYLAHRPATAERTFGLLRLEILAA